MRDGDTGEARWIAILLPDGKSVTFSAAGQVLDGSPQTVEKHFVYVVENEHSQFELLKPSQFRKLVAENVKTLLHK